MADSATATRSACARSARARRARARRMMNYKSAKDRRCFCRHWSQPVHEHDRSVAISQCDVLP